MEYAAMLRELCLAYRLLEDHGKLQVRVSMIIIVMLLLRILIHFDCASGADTRQRVAALDR
jgi:hypothetical protein